MAEESQPPQGFRPRSEHELAALSPERLLAYHVAARAAGDHASARTALAILVWGFSDRVRFWVRRRLDPGELQDLDDIVGEVFASALKSSFAFEGTELRSFGSWLREIAQRRAVDYVRRRAHAPRTQPLAEEHEGEEEVWGATKEVPDPTQEIVERSVVEQALAELSPVHARVVELAGPADLASSSAPRPRRRRS